MTPGADMYMSILGAFFANEEERRLAQLKEEAINGKPLIGDLKFKYTKLDKAFKKKHNIIADNDYGHLYLGDKKVSDKVYRIGGMGIGANDDYALILRYKVSIYKGNGMGKYEGQSHYEGIWVIIDKFGNEKVIFDSHSSPYLTGGVIYSNNNSYYNIETGELYCSSVFTTMKTDNYLFLDNQYDDDKERRGVWQINLADGTYKIIK